LLDDYLKEIGTASPDLRIPASVLRRRISERIPERTYRSQPDLPFVGRDAEMALLAERFRMSLRGNSQCVVISGEPGIGKTRLAAEFANVAALDGARVESTTAQSHDVHRPLGAFIELLPRLLQLPGALGCSTESMRALRRLTTHDPGDQFSPPKTIADAETVFGGIVRAIDDVVDAISSELSLVLIFEDTHWLDPLSIRVIGDLVSTRKGRTLFVVLTTREEVTFNPRVRYADCVEPLRLKGISLDAATALIARLIGPSRANNQALCGWMASVSSGNPLFISTVTTHYLTTEEPFSVPQSLLALLGRRLDTIDQRTFAVVQMSAALGKFCTLSRLVASLEMATVDLLQAVQEAENRRLITVDGSRVTVSHALLAEAVIERSTDLALRLIHRRAAEVLEADTSKVPAATQLWELAEHWVAAAEPGRALKAFRVCAQHSIEIGRPREAALALNRALALPLEPSTLAEVARDLVLTAGGCSEFELVRRGTAVWRAINMSIDHDEAELAELRTRAILHEDIDSTLDRISSCVGDHTASAAHRAEAATLMLVVSHHRNRTDLAETANRLFADVLESNDGEECTVEFSLIYHCMVGDLDEAATNAFRLRALAEHRSPAAAARMHLNASRALWIAGLLNEALDCCEAAHTLATKHGLARLAVQSAVRRATYLVDLAGPTPEVWSQFCSFDEAIGELIDENIQSETLTVHTLLALADGKVEQAAACFQKLANATGASPIQRRWIEMLRLRLRQVEGDQKLLDLDLAPLISSATRLPRQEIADIEMSIVIEALLARGQVADARQLGADYVERRRLSRSPLDFSLNQTMQRAMNCN
jgi:hypothetical protein